MKSISLLPARCVSVAVLALATGAVQAHTGHASSGAVDGLVHPFGRDHLLAMLAVGILCSGAGIYLLGQL